MKSSDGNSNVSLPKVRVGALALHRIIQWSRRKFGLFGRKEIVYNFSDIETGPAGSDEIQKLAREAGQAAASEAKAVGIPKVFAKNGQILKQYPDGRIEIVAIAEGLTEKMFFRQLKSGILHARKK